MMTMTTIHPNDAYCQPAVDLADLIDGLEQRCAGLDGPTLAAELAALRAIGVQLLAEVKAASSANQTGVDLRRISNAELRAVLIAQRGAQSAANFCTRLARDLAKRRGALKIASGGEIIVR
jgi:hypothetical protein